MNKRWLGLILSLILITGGIYWGLAADDGTDSPPSPSSQQEQTEEQVPQREASRVEINVSSDEGSTELKLIADRLSQSSSESELNLQQVVIKAYDKQGGATDLQATLTAPQGYYWPQKGRLEFEGPVEVQNDKVEIKADTLRWDQKENRWIGKGSIVIIHYQQEVKITGERFTAKVDLNKLHVTGNVRAAQYKPKAGEINAAREE
ncbi:LPS export ABC transporter periplasmic protein LptC [Acetohalobium arabaticum]|uniref:LPS export ABC transporter periplasmic protein LptC n=1 Tax=Acetohalobium arabaticum (strain ATCC 49924 / DSM 5501 / Z-7288) TaxID=574087 RepID=D9QTU5_ACEAZ|nr:LPS export ABC transporter periplasmic protein LptC [Acetohalobium arabaticum]ADL13666.1 protein of unknown function DUF1239 [Acetohalobium arabaticum DSM 5501]